MEQKFKVGDYVRLKKEFYKEDEFKSMSRLLRQCVSLLKNGKSDVLGVMDSKLDYGRILVAHGEDVYILPTCIFELVEPEKKPVVEVKRQAKVGEWIKIVNAEYASGGYKDGDILQVGEAYLSLKAVRIKGICTGIYNREYVVLENYEQPKKHNDALDALTHSCEALSKSFSKHVNLMTKTRRWTPEEIVKAKFLLASELIFYHCKFVRDGHRTACYNFVTGKSAESKPSPDDEYNEYIGAVVAYCKTCGVKIPEFITK